MASNYAYDADPRNLPTVCSNGADPYWIPRAPAGPGVCYDTHKDNGTVMYESLNDFLPVPSEQWANDLELYLPVMDGCSATDSYGKESYYFTWVSKRHYQPILSGLVTSGNNPYKGQRSKKFGTCCINGVTHNDYNGNRTITQEQAGEYCGSGANCFDRGHQAASSEIGDMFDYSAQTFNMCNIGPQTADLNQNKWQLLEHFIHCIEYKIKGAIVLSGPVGPFVKAFKAAGPSPLNDASSIPNKWWKMLILRHPTTGAVVQTFLWLYVNDSNPGITVGEGSVGAEALDEIEAGIGFVFPATIRPTIVPPQRVCDVLHALNAECNTQECNQIFIPKKTRASLVRMGTLRIVGVHAPPPTPMRAAMIPRRPSYRLSWVR